MLFEILSSSPLAMFLCKLKIIFNHIYLCISIVTCIIIDLHFFTFLLFAAFLLYTLQVAMAFALMSALYGDFMQVWSKLILIKEPDFIDQIININRNHCIDKSHVHFAHTSKYLLNWWKSFLSFMHWFFLSFYQTVKKRNICWEIKLLL